jgi:hypothetical protein
MSDQQGICYFKEALLHRYAPPKNLFAEQATRDPEIESKLKEIRKKIYDHLVKKDWTLEEFFRIVDKDDSKGITVMELTVGVKDVLTEDEALTLFKIADRRKENQVDLASLKHELVQIKVARILEKLE